MRAVQFDMGDPAFGASLAEVPEPELPGADWARVAVETGGICGSDLHLFAHNTGPSPTLMGLAGAVPVRLGPEAGGGGGGGGGPCANCAKGWTSDCLRLDSRVVTGGRSLGYTQGLGGGWAEHVLAHSSMIHALPDAVPYRAASLYEPVSIACHGVMRAAPRDGEPALVVGAGIIGLAALAALKGL